MRDIWLFDDTAYKDTGRSVDHWKHTSVLSDDDDDDDVSTAITRKESPVSADSVTSQ